jgi:hypothetical protein
LQQVRTLERGARGSAGGARSRAHPAPASQEAPRLVIRGGKSRTGKSVPRGGKTS